MDENQKLSYDIGVAKGRAQEKGSQLMEKVGTAVQSAKETVQEAGQQVKTKTVVAADAVTMPLAGTNKPQ